MFDTPGIDQKTHDTLSKTLDRDVLRGFEKFLHAVNARSEWQWGLRDSYDPPDEAMGPDVEYFHPVITYNDMMRHIADNFVYNDIEPLESRLLNTVMFHLYGARGIHSTLTGKKNPREALVSLAEIAREQRQGKPGDYTMALRRQSVKARRAGLPFWGTTELHSSIQAAGKRFAREIGGEDWDSQGACAEWVASWINDGTVDRLFAATSLRGLYDVFMSIRGIGPYYAVHEACSGSHFPEINAYHDERFCDPGTGAVLTSTKMWPGLSAKQVPHDIRIIWIRNMQHELMDMPKIHPKMHNVVVEGKDIYPEPQDEIKTYGMEVAICQYSVYERLKENPHLISKRKVSRATDCSSLEELFT